MKNESFEKIMAEEGLMVSIYISDAPERDVKEKYCVDKGKSDSDYPFGEWTFREKWRKIKHPRKK